MFHATSVLPAGAGECDDGFPIRDRLRLRDNFGYVLQELRKRGTAFRSLAKGPWSVFIAIAAHFQLNAEAWPGQEAIAHFSGCSIRAVRYYVAELERGGFLALRRERRGDGSERVFYRPGRVMLQELAAFCGDYPKDHSATLKTVGQVQATAVPTSTHPPAAVAVTPPATVAGELRELNQNQSSSCLISTRTASLEPDEKQQPIVSQVDRQIARWALAERMKRKYPKRPPPRWYDQSDVEMVAICTAAVDGDRAAKEQAQREAIVGAFSSSKTGPPTALFIWGKLAHFFEHVECGKRKLATDAREMQRRAQAIGPLRDGQRQGTGSTNDSTSNNVANPDELAKTRAEFEQIAAQTPPPYRRTLERIIGQYRELERKARSSRMGDWNPPQ
jgi:hypothetical protein